MLYPGHLLHYLSAVALSLILIGCQTAGAHRKEVSAIEGEKVTVGTVQREIRQGMPAHKVLEVLGSPNIVTKNGENGETWVYDKFSTETAYSTSKSGVSALIIAGGSSTVGGVGGSYGNSTGATSTTQRTLTIIIQMQNGVVEKFTYHSSRF